MTDPWTFTNPPGDPLADLKNARRALDQIPKPTCDRFKVSSRELVDEHLDVRGYQPVWGALAGAPLFGIPLVVDETVEPGWIEAWLGDECVDRIGIA